MSVIKNEKHTFFITLLHFWLFMGKALAIQSFAIASAIYTFLLEFRCTGELLVFCECSAQCLKDGIAKGNAVCVYWRAYLTSCTYRTLTRAINERTVGKYGAKTFGGGLCFVLFRSTNGKGRKYIIDPHKMQFSMCHRRLSERNKHPKCVWRNIVKWRHKTLSNPERRMACKPKREN